MRKIPFTLLLLLVLATNTSAQLKTYFSIDAGPAWNLNRIEDPGHYFEQTMIPNTSSGISISQEIIPNLSIGTGATYHYYSSGINPQDARNHEAMFRSYRTLLIPAYISYRIQIADFPLSLTGKAGYQYGILLNDPVLQMSNSLISDQDGNTITYSLQESNLTTNSLGLIETGISADYRFDNNWQISLALSFFSGTNEVKSSVLNYQVGTNSYQANYINNGSRWQSLVSVSIPVSNIWENSDLRKHKKIEYSSNRGSNIRVKRHIYFGGDLGALWRSFSTSNPAIGARPLAQRGIFRYSNLHTGVYFGYVTRYGAAIDIGAYFQRSSTFFSAMYDHEVDFVTKERAPFFLEFPVMFRYLYPTYFKDLTIIPSIGGSVLTHFAGTATHGGTGTFEYMSSSGMQAGSLTYNAGRVAQFGFMMKAGLGAEYNISRKLPLTAIANLSYSQGFRDIDKISITTSVNESPEENYVIYSGSGWNFSLGIKYTILLGKENKKCGAESRFR